MENCGVNVEPNIVSDKLVNCESNIASGLRSFQHFKTTQPVVTSTKQCVTTKLNSNSVNILGQTLNKKFVHIVCFAALVALSLVVYYRYFNWDEEDDEEPSYEQQVQLMYPAQVGSEQPKTDVENIDV